MLRPSFAATTRRRRADSGERRTLTVRFSAGVADFGGAIDPILYERMFYGGCITHLNSLFRGTQASHPTPVRCTAPIMLYRGPRHVAFADGSLRHLRRPGAQAVARRPDLKSLGHAEATRHNSTTRGVWK